MSITQEDLNAKVAEIKQKVDVDPEKFLISTVNLTDADCALMGKLIQLYCFADLNARRIIDALRDASMGPEKRNASLLQDAQVFPKLRETIAEVLPDGNDKEGIIKAADTIEMHRIHRHTFAHWAARRVPGEEALILYTKNAREAERRDGKPLGTNYLKYAIVSLLTFDEEIKKLAGHGDYIAQRAAEYERNIELIRKTLAERR
ncbi:hypothetical protein [Methylobacterium tarhaniae]|uniref:hypothetical protein n=1 Tax=Methylobacterium tarhaniae TaxID=1187852 RepID=UPI003D018841